MPLQARLLNWFKKNARSLPWREKPHWYKTFLSEIILQQTTVDQGLPYFKKIYSAYPDVHKLAAANEQDILKLWAGLGYYARGRNLLKAARKIVEQFDGTFPRDMSGALSLPGIGPYSAAAILSIAFNRPHAVVDGNVLRVLTRLSNNPSDIRKSGVKKAIGSLARQLLDKNNPGDFNEAIMELGAMICLPQQPLCDACPLARDCEAHKEGTTARIPYKSPPAPRKKQYHIVTVFKKGTRYLLRQRPQTGLLGGMWEFPYIETTAPGLKIDAIKNTLKAYTIEKDDISPAFRQIYSHIDLRFTAICLHPKSDMQIPGKWIESSGFQEYPIHNAHKKIIAWLNSPKNL